MRVVLCHGCFDILHVGHFRHLQQAKSWGDRLVVSVTAARFVAAAKGAGRPAHTDAERLYQLMALTWVDEAVICEDASGVPSILVFRPAIYAKGSDYEGRGINPREGAACRAVGAEIRFTNTAKRSIAELTRDFARREA